MATVSQATARRASGCRPNKPELFPEEAPLAPLWDPSAAGVLRATEMGGLYLNRARRGLGKATACSCVIGGGLSSLCPASFVGAGWGRVRPFCGEGARFAAQRPERPRRSGELAARLETRTQEFTSRASERPGGNAWLREVPLERREPGAGEESLARPCFSPPDKGPPSHAQ